MKNAIAYYRVSTERQGKSGLGLDAQQTAIKSYCTANDYKLLMEIEEIRSSRKHRPALQDALLHCKKIQATLIVARLDRLGRDVEEIAGIVKSNVDLIVTDNPHANRFTIHILAAVAEEQRRTISENTKSALQAAKQRGKQLGNYAKQLSQQNKLKADTFARNINPLIQKLKNEGITSFGAISDKLNELRVPTFRPGHSWHKTSVYNLMRRIDKLYLDNAA
jgi:DNA invertase Pin-like site-specific DNA recombinase